MHDLKTSKERVGRKKEDEKKKTTTTTPTIEYKTIFETCVLECLFINDDNYILMEYRISRDRTAIPR